MPYRGYTIRLTSGQVTEPEGWVARAELTPIEPSGMPPVRVADPQFSRFASQDEADELALKIAHAWVDQRSSA
jgi:hypothetical protein